MAQAPLLREEPAQRPLTVAILVGEESGDRLGAGLIDALRRARPESRFVGTAGERMTARGMASWFPVSDVAVMGVGDVLAHLPRIVSRIRRTVAMVAAARPDVLVVVDSPGFTHAVAERVARRLPELPIVNYVSPSVWAWKAWRAPRMARFIDDVLALLPFEPEVHARLGGPPCTYVGHPLIEDLGALRPAPGERKPLSEGRTLLVLPGSRITEIRRLMRPFGEAAAQVVAAAPGTRALLPAVAHLRRDIEARAADWAVSPEIVSGEAAKFAAFRSAHAALAASGSVTLELALSGVPQVVAYRVDPMLRPLKGFLRVPSVVLANLVIGENVVPEFLDRAGAPEALAATLLPLLADTPERRRQTDGYARLDALMRSPGGRPPSERAAEIVLFRARQGAAPHRLRTAAVQRRREIGT